MNPSRSIATLLALTSLAACAPFDGPYAGEATLTSGTGPEAASAMHASVALCLEDYRAAIHVGDESTLAGDFSLPPKGASQATFIPYTPQPCTLPGPNGPMRVVVRNGQAHFTYANSPGRGGPTTYAADLTLGVAPIDAPDRATVYRFTGVHGENAPRCQSVPLAAR